MATCWLLKQRIVKNLWFFMENTVLRTFLNGLYKLTEDDSRNVTIIANNFQGFIMHEINKIKTYYMIQDQDD